jgi:uncharacterized delta-60 repeat protein
MGGSNEDVLRMMVPHADRRLTVVGRSLDSAAVANLAFGRLLSNGERDFSYNTPTGVRTHPNFDGHMDMDVDAQGRILALHSVLGGMSIARFLPDGTLDTSFSGDGILDIALPVQPLSWGALLPLPDGKIAMTSSVPSGGNYNLAFARVTADGNLDSTFDGDGKGIYTVATVGNRVVKGMALRPNGRWFIALGLITLGGPTPSTLAMACTANAGDGTFHCDESNNDASDFPSCPAAGGQTSINSITRMPDGSVIGVGSYNDAPITNGVYREMAMLWPPNSVEAVDAVCLGGTPVRFGAAVTRTSSRTVIATINSSPTTVSLRNITMFSPTNIEFGARSGEIDWPTENGTASPLGYGGEHVAYRNGYAYAGATRYWSASDKDFAIARFKTDELFSDSWGD